MFVYLPPEGLGRERPEHRQDAGVVGETQFGQDVERPQIGLLEPTVAHAEAEHLLASSRLDGVAGEQHVFAELCGSQIANVAMREVRASDFMTASRDLGHDLRQLRRNPTEHKECGFGLVLIEQIQSRRRIAFEPRVEAIPLLAIDELLKGSDLKPVFELNREDVLSRPSRDRTDGCKLAPQRVRWQSGGIQSVGWEIELRGHYRFSGLKRIRRDDFRQ